VNTIINLRVPYIFGKFLSSCVTGGFSRRAQFRGVSVLIIQIFLIILTKSPYVSFLLLRHSQIQHYSCRSLVNIPTMYLSLTLQSSP
jgi:hypothetical protein